jgi:hypothetical protein
MRILASTENNLNILASFSALTITANLHISHNTAFHTTKHFTKHNIAAKHQSISIYAYTYAVQAQLSNRKQKIIEIFQNKFSDIIFALWA